MLGDILTLRKPMASCFIRALYVVALVLVTLRVVRGVALGGWMFGRPPPPPQAISDNATATSQPQAEQPPPPRPGIARRGGRRMAGPAFLRQGPMPGILLIIRALLMGAVSLMV